VRGRAGSQERKEKGSGVGLGRDSKESKKDSFGGIL